LTRHILARDTNYIGDKWSMCPTSQSMLECRSRSALLLGFVSSLHGYLILAENSRLMKELTPRGFFFFTRVVKECRRPTVNTPEYREIVICGIPACLRVQIAR
jgi:hypothetical protein